MDTVRGLQLYYYLNQLDKRVEADYLNQPARFISPLIIGELLPDPKSSDLQSNFLSNCLGLLLRSAPN